MLDFRSKTSYCMGRGEGKEEAVTEDVSESGHVRPIRCLRTQMCLVWLEIWRHFILGMWSIQPFCWDLLHSVVPHGLSWHLLSMKGQPCISIYTLEFAFQASPTPTVSYTFLSLAYVYLYFFRVHNCFNNRNLSLSTVLPLVCCSRISRKSCCSFLWFFTRKDFIERTPAAGEKTLLQLQENLRGCCAYPLFLITVLLQRCHSCPDVFGSSLFSWKLMLRLSHFNFSPSTVWGTLTLCSVNLSVILLYFSLKKWGTYDSLFPNFLELKQSIKQAEKLKPCNSEVSACQLFETRGTLDS